MAVGLVLQPDAMGLRPASVIGYGLQRAGSVERFENLELLARTLVVAKLSPKRLLIEQETATFVNLPTFSWYQLQLEQIGAGAVLVDVEECGE